MWIKGLDKWKKKKKAQVWFSLSLLEVRDIWRNKEIFNYKFLMLRQILWNLLLIFEVIQGKSSKDISNLLMEDKPNHVMQFSYFSNYIYICMCILYCIRFESLKFLNCRNENQIFHRMPFWQKRCFLHPVVMWMLVTWLKPDLVITQIIAPSMKMC